MVVSGHTLKDRGQVECVTLLSAPQPLVEKAQDKPDGEQEVRWGSSEISIPESCFWPSDPV